MTQASDQAACAARAALEKGAATLSGKEFEGFLAGIVREVIRHVLDVRAGRLKPEEASDMDDATVRTLAQILMGEHEKIRLVPGGSAPTPGPELASAMLLNLPSLFRELPAASLAGNPRPLMVHAARVFLKETYAMLRAAAAEGTELTDERLRIRIDRLAGVWAERVLGDSLSQNAPDGEVK